MALSSNLLITVVVDKASIGNFVLNLVGGQVTLTSFAEKDEPAKTDTGLHLTGERRRIPTRAPARARASSSTNES